MPLFEAAFDFVSISVDVFRALERINEGPLIMHLGSV